MSSSLGPFDLRIPLGLLFLVLGALLLVAGLTDSPAQNQHSLGMNINFCWSWFLLGFGALCLFLAWRGKRR